jgi:hypothetical protein
MVGTAWKKGKERVIWLEDEADLKQENNELL